MLSLLLLIQEPQGTALQIRQLRKEALDSVDGRWRGAASRCGGGRLVFSQTNCPDDAERESIVGCGEPNQCAESGCGGDGDCAPLLMRRRRRYPPSHQRPSLPKMRRRLRQNPGSRSDPAKAVGVTLASVSKENSPPPPSPTRTAPVAANVTADAKTAYDEGSALLEQGKLAGSSGAFQ